MRTQSDAERRLDHLFALAERPGCEGERQAAIAALRRTVAAKFTATDTVPAEPAKKPRLSDPIKSRRLIFARTGPRCCGYDVVEVRRPNRWRYTLNCARCDALRCWLATFRRLRRLRRPGLEDGL